MTPNKWHKRAKDRLHKRRGIMALVPFAISIAVGIVVLVTIFSIFPTIMAQQACPAVTGDTDGDYVEDAGENWSDDDASDAWKVSCNDLRVQTTVVPTLITLAVVVSAILILMRIFA